MIIREVDEILVNILIIANINPIRVLVCFFISECEKKNFENRHFNEYTGSCVIGLALSFY